MEIEQQQNQQRMDWVDFARGIGILLVVFNHVQHGLYRVGINGPKFLFYVEQVIYRFDIHTFFFLSGLFVEKSLSKGNKAFIWDKVTTILYPYFLWSLLHGSIQLILSPYTNEKLTIIDLVKIIYLPIAHFWFLQTLFLISIIYACIRKYIPIYVIIAIALAMYAVALFTTIAPVRNLLGALVFFVTGSMFMKISHKIDTYINGWKLLLIISIFIIFQIINIHFDSLNWPIIRFFAAFVGIGFVISLSIYISGKIGLGIIGKLGFLSMPIYLAHVMGGAASRIILLRFFHVQDFYIHLLMGCLAGVIFPVLLFVAMNRLGFPYLFTLSKSSALAGSISASRISQEKS
jgi:fucose 4-O-acetylase-like acetyltransferase